MLNKPWIYLLRHGEIDTPERKVFIGQNELPLSSRGRERRSGGEVSGHRKGSRECIAAI